MSPSNHKINVAFLAVVITFSLGLGAFDRLPYLLYEYSETPFLLIYFISTIFLVTPVLLMEMYLGTPKTHKASFNLTKIMSKSWNFALIPLIIFPICMFIYFLVISFMPLLYGILSLNLFHGISDVKFLSFSNYNHFDTFFVNNFGHNFLDHLLFTSILLILSTLILIDRAIIFRLTASAIFLLLSITIMFLLLLTNTIYDGSLEYSVRTMLSFSFSGFGLNIASFHCVVDAVYYAFFTVGAGTGILIAISYKFSLSQKHLFKDILLFSFINFLISIILSYIIIAMLHSLGEAPSKVGIKSLFIDLPNYFYSIEDGTFLSVGFYGIIAWCYFYALTVIIISIFNNLKVNYNISIYQKFIIFVIFVILDMLVSGIDLDLDIFIKYISYIYVFFYHMMLPLSIISISFITGYVRKAHTYKAIYRSIVLDDHSYRRKVVISILFTIRIIIPIIGGFLIVISILFW